MRKEKNAKIYRSVDWRLAACLLALWLLAMVLLTIAVAEMISEVLYDHDSERAYEVSRYRLDYTQKDYEMLPGQAESYMWDAISTGPYAVSAWSVPDRHPWPQVLEGSGYEFDGAAAIFDPAGNLLEGGQDLLYFPYEFEVDWEDFSNTRTVGYAKVVLDLDALPEESRSLLANRGSIFHHDVLAMRLTGVLEGAEFRPAKIEYISWYDYNGALETLPPTSTRFYGDGSVEREYDYTVEEVLGQADITWRVFLEDESVPAEVTIYTTYPQILLRSETGPAWDHGNRYEDLFSFVEDLGPIYRFPEDGTGHPSRFYKGPLLDFITVDVRYFFDYGDVGSENWDWSQGEPDPAFYLVTAVHRYPYKDAMGQLRWVYLGTFLAAVWLYFALRNRLWRELIGPMVRVNAGAAAGWERIYFYQNPKWPEGVALTEHYREAAETLQRQKNEITRLQTALDYAKNAEENRRRMTSHIAHELKTPLAVVHSYAEGLQAHIAEEKREKYLSVILGECERMDGMVLEMLDLSRLEAGKVTLARDDFDLSALAEEVFQRLTEGRNIRLTLDLRRECVVNADRARMEQVITNFASNALRHTPEGGEIKVRTARIRREVSLYVENQGEPLAAEELGRVWDTFYRGAGEAADSGTGLGLAISRSIIALHGGTCGVRNTALGVEFWFTI